MGSDTPNREILIPSTMNRPINVEQMKQERRIEDVIQGKWDGKYKIYAEAALILKVPQATVYARVNGRHTT